MALVGGVECGGSRARRRALWLLHVRAWSASGLRAAEYCRRKGLHPESFYRWRRVLLRAGADVGLADRVEPMASQAPRFAEVHVADARGGFGACAIEVVVSGERRIRVAPGFDEAALRRVVTVLEALPC